MISCNGGIGRECVKKLIKKNYYIYLTVHEESELEIIKNKFSDYNNIECFKLDITNKEDLKKLNDLDVDILINMAAIGYGGSILEIPIDKVKDNFQVNVFSYFEAIQIVLKKMMDKNEGKVIIISSLASIIPLKFLGVYSATKASITNITTALQKEIKLIDGNIKVVLIEPGMYHTGFNQLMLENKYDWMKKKSYFKEELELIKKQENLFFSLIEKKKFNSIVNKIIKATESNNPKKIYRAPLSQVIGAKLYHLFRM